jgi:polar amino acid transport system substrate-binding protein
MRYSNKSMIVVGFLSNILVFGAYADDFKGPISICDDDAEWPPYTYNVRAADGNKTPDITGYSVELIRTIFDKKGIKNEIKLMPWARCVEELKTGKSYQMALNASYNADRAKVYNLSSKTYTMTNYYFYSKKHHPEGIAIKELADLKKYKVCGVNGYNYEPYGFKKGDMDQGAHDIGVLVSKIHEGRCDLFLEKYEVLKGFGAVGQNFFANTDFAASPVPGMAGTEFYMMMSKGYEQAEALKKAVNDGIAEMQASGELDKLLKKYIP